MIFGVRQLAAALKAAAEPPHSESVRWRRLYAIVLIELAVTITVFYAFTKAFQ